jgi:HK97 family phage portal protein
MAIWPFTFFERKQTDADILEMLGGGAPTSSGVAVSPSSALCVPAVAASVRTISEACASLDCRVVEIGDDGTETVTRSHPANALVADEANEWTSSFELIRQLVVDALTRDQGGLAWVNWLRNEPVEIVRYRPGIIGAEYDPDGSGRATYRINGSPTPADQIIHVRSTFEKSPVTLCREAIGAALVMEQHAAKLFVNGARPSGQIVSPKSLGDEGVKKMIKGFMAAYGGASKSGGTPIFWDGTEFKAISMSSVDAQFQQLRIFQLQEIARAFNVPAILIGELSRATWSNSAEMQRLFLMLCLEPWLQALESAFRRALIAKEGRKRFAIRFERDDFSKVDLSVLATALNSLIASRVLNPNTAREWLGLPPYDGGEDYANPNTGASQPGIVTPPAAPVPPQPNEDDE